MNNKLTADDVKIRLLAWLIPQILPGEALASELRFLDGRRRADLAIISSSKLLGIEVKGPRDNLSTLTKQIEDYDNAFLQTYVATTIEHLPEARRSIPRKVGLIEVTMEQVRIVRKARKRNTLSKTAAVTWLLKRDFSMLHTTLGTTEDEGLITLQRIATRNMDQAQLISFVLNRIYKRVVSRHDDFIDELGEALTLDDVKMLTVSQRIRL